MTLRRCLKKRLTTFCVEGPPCSWLFYYRLVPLGGFGRPMYEDGTTKAVLAASPGDEDAVRSKVMVGRKGTKVLTNEAGEVTSSLLGDQVYT
ncbi:uncharacterized protein LOC123408389 isoform X2 [Hordeum vulgare subsp. vulgare]|uniref:uncharacterized protein LOC123408389 isoform X2 n=1 Tax=Hordeum vulgare subsp. vulgare TaxID=112509 RepID=UPI001D1A4DE7|nr:uncharacterized protein LOC123408389 isoform X2 [Hordeum vulgare subsp. vulgare]